MTNRAEFTTNCCRLPATTCPILVGRMALSEVIFFLLGESFVTFIPPPPPLGPLLSTQPEATVAFENVCLQSLRQNRTGDSYWMHGEQPCRGGLKAIRLFPLSGLLFLLRHVPCLPASTANSVEGSLNAGRNHLSIFHDVHCLLSVQGNPSLLLFGQQGGGDPTRHRRTRHKVMMRIIAPYP